MMPGQDLSVSPSAAIVESVDELWGLPYYPAGCALCGQAHLVEKAIIGQACPNCGLGDLGQQPARMRPEPPEKMLAFEISPGDLRAILTEFVRPVWLRPDDLNPLSMLQRAVRVCWPMWLVDADLLGAWEAEVGYDYQVKSSQETYRDGRWQTHEVIETRTRWEPRLGQLNRRYENIATPAIEDQLRWKQLAGEYRLDLTLNYEASLIEGALLRIPDLPPESAWPPAESNLHKAAAEEVRLSAGGQHIRQFSLQTSYENVHWTQLLLPLYFTFHLDDQGRRQPVYINGQNGKVGGIRMASQAKGWLWGGILALAGLVLLTSGLLAAAVGSILPLAAVVGLPLVLLGVVVGLLAIVPLTWPWRWNRAQKPLKVYRVEV